MREKVFLKGKGGKMILTFCGRDEDTELRDIFLECMVRYANPLIVWKKADNREVIISRDEEKEKLTGNITMDLIEVTIRKMCSGVVGEKESPDPGLKKRILQGILP